MTSKRHGDKTQPTVYGVGTFGEGNYRSRVDGKMTPQYTLWINMLQRVYNVSNLHDKFPCYIGTSLCKRWHNYQLFAEDISKVPNFGNKGFELDKDLKYPGNKRYAPKYCTFVPKVINLLVCDSPKPNRKLPKGVCKTGNRYEAGIHINTYGIRVRKTFDNIPDAHAFYIKAKRGYVRKMARLFRDQIHPRVYRNLRAYDGL